MPSATIDFLVAISVLLISVSGLYIIFGVLRIINMAHGEFMMLGAYLCFYARSYVHNFPLSAIIAGVLVAALGFGIERLIVRKLHGRNDSSSLLATWGVSLCLTEGVRLIVGPSGISLDSPMTGIAYLGSVAVPAYRVLLIGIALIITTALFFVLYRTSVGIAVRATVENPALAECFGVSSSLLRTRMFLFGSFLAGLAGALLGPLSSVTPTMGNDYSLSAFMVVISAGSTSWSGLIGSVMLVGGTKSVLSSLTGETGSMLGALVMTLLVVLLRAQFTKRQ